MATAARIIFRNRLDPDGPSKTAVMGLGAIALTGLAPIASINAAGLSHLVEWEAVAFSVDYILRVGTSPGASNTFNAATGSTTPSYLLTGLSPGSYYWAIRPVGLDGGTGQQNQGEESSEENFSV